MKTSYDFAVIGGGIVGLSVGMALGEQFPGRRILVLEKELRWADHQTGNNSGVIHSGIYYKPGSLKAILASKGNRSMVEFCAKHGIDHEISRPQQVLGTAVPGEAAVVARARVGIYHARSAARHRPRGWQNRRDAPLRPLPPVPPGRQVARRSGVGLAATR